MKEDIMMFNKSDIKKSGGFKKKNNAKPLNIKL